MPPRYCDNQLCEIDWSGRYQTFIELFVMVDFVQIQMSEFCLEYQFKKNQYYVLRPTSWPDKFQEWISEIMLCESSGGIQGFIIPQWLTVNLYTVLWYQPKLNTDRLKPTHRSCFPISSTFFCILYFYFIYKFFSFGNPSKLQMVRLDADVESTSFYTPKLAGDTHEEKLRLFINKKYDRKICTRFRCTACFGYSYL